MKKARSIIVSTMLALLVSVSAMAQSDAKVIAVMHKADWCSTCEKNGERAMKALMSDNSDMAVHIIANDVTNDETKIKSAVELEKFGLEKAVDEKCNATGVAYFFNSETKELISQVSMAKSDQVLSSALTDAKKSLKK